MLSVMNEIGAMGIAPTANAGVNISGVAAGSTFQLDGSASSDIDGSIVSFEWEQTAGVEVALDLTDPIRPKGVAPTRSEDSVLTFKLKVTDDGNLVSSSSVDVEINAALAQLPLFYTPIKSQLGRDDDDKSDVVTLYQHTDNVLVVDVLDQNDKAIDLQQVSSIEYRLENAKGSEVCVLTLDKGISILDSKVIVHIPDDVITDKIKGFHYHQLTVHSGGFKLPPVFYGKVRIAKVLN